MLPFLVTKSLKPNPKITSLVQFSSDSCVIQHGLAHSLFQLSHPTVNVHVFVQRVLKIFPHFLMQHFGFCCVYMLFLHKRSHFLRLRFHTSTHMSQLHCFVNNSDHVLYNLKFRQISSAQCIATRLTK